MDVQVRNALTHAIVQRDKRSLRAESLFHGKGQEPRVTRELRQDRRRNINQTVNVLPRDQETMPGKERPMIEKRKRPFVLKDNACLHAACSNLAEDAVTHRNESSRLRLGAPRSDRTSEPLRPQWRGRHHSEEQNSLVIRCDDILLRTKVVPSSSLSMTYGKIPRNRCSVPHVNARIWGFGQNLPILNSKVSKFAAKFPPAGNSLWLLASIVRSKFWKLNHSSRNQVCLSTRTRSGSGAYREA